MSREYVEAKVSPEPNSGCWLWMASYGPKGYGQAMVNYKGLRAHRLSFEVFKGPIPDGLLVLHKCDQPCCVNPQHLFLGTALDNAHDRDVKGRARPASKRPFCKRGHAMVESNLYHSANGYRACRACALLRAKERR